MAGNAEYKVLQVPPPPPPGGKCATWGDHPAGPGIPENASACQSSETPLARLRALFEGGVGGDRPTGSSSILWGPTSPPSPGPSPPSPPARC
jgi:hypothetical protein